MQEVEFLLKDAVDLLGVPRSGFGNRNPRLYIGIMVGDDLPDSVIPGDDLQQSGANAAFVKRNTGGWLRHSGNGGEGFEVHR
jgi:hypothetical protein